jgi:hypothetical protein
MVVLRKINTGQSPKELVNKKMQQQEEMVLPFICLVNSVWTHNLMNKNKDPKINLDRKVAFSAALIISSKIRQMHRLRMNRYHFRKQILLSH